MQQELIDYILQYAKQLGASEVETSISKAQGFSVTVRLGEVDTIEHDQDKGLAINVYFGKRLGSTSTNDLAQKSIKLAVEKACDIARYTEDDPYSGLADAKLMAYDYPDLDLCHPWDITIEQAIDLAKQCEAIGMAYDKRITNSEGVSIDAHTYSSIYGNSHGFIGGYPTSVNRISCCLLASQNNSMQRDYDYTVARSAKDLEAITILGKHAAEKTVLRLGAKTLATQQSPVIFAADIAKGLLATFISAISGGNLYRKSSFLLDQLNQQIFSDFIQIDERPHLIKGLGSAPFDNEGVKTYAKDFVKNGILQNYALGTYSARKLNMQTTANAGGVYNLFINANAKGSELFKLMNKGLYVTELMGQGVNIVTGDFSCGAFGYWIENGELQYPVAGITIAGNLKNMFLDIIAVGDDIDQRGSINTGSILIKNMTIAGQ